MLDADRASTHLDGQNVEAHRTLVQSVTTEIETGDTDDLPLYEDVEALPLYVDDHAVTCGTPTLAAGFECEGWAHDEIYRLHGSLERLVLGGRATDEIGFTAEREQ